jgi:chaperone modulatory protein CbpM
MIALEALLQIVRVEESELRHWIESGWVLPEGDTGRWVFHEVDVARVRLIAEIRYDLAIDDGALPVVLSLLDQLYGLRRELQALCGAVAAQPSEVRDAIAAAIGGSERKP